LFVFVVFIFTFVLFFNQKLSPYDETDTRLTYSMVLFFKLLLHLFMLPFGL